MTYIEPRQPSQEADLIWRKMSEEEYSAGHRRMLRRTYELPDGRQELFDIKYESPSVCILALTDRKEVILARQYRPGPDRVVRDLPGGAIDSGETPLEAAMRELREETGYEGMFQPIGTCLEDGYSTKIRHNFIATHCKRVSDPTPDKNEFIMPELVGLPEFRELLRSGQLTVVETGYLGLDALGLL